MNSLPKDDVWRLQTQKLVYWAIWSMILVGLLAAYLVVERVPLPEVVTTEQTLMGLVGFAPLFLSVVIRWLVLPRFSDPVRALPFFIVGVALAEACGLLGVFLGGPYRDDFALLGALGIVQYLPFLLRKLFVPAVAAGLRGDH